MRPSSGAAVLFSFISAPFFLRPTKKNRSPIRANAHTPPIAIPAMAPTESETPDELWVVLLLGVGVGVAVLSLGMGSPGESAKSAWPARAATWST